MARPARAHPSTRVSASRGLVLTVTDTGRETLVAARKSAGLTQRGLAGRAGCSQTFVWMVESGRRSRISAALADVMVAALDIPVSSLTAHAPTESRPSGD